MEAVTAEDMTTGRDLDAGMLVSVFVPTLYALVVVELVVFLNQHDVILQESALGRQTGELFKYNVAIVEEAHLGNEELSSKAR